MSSLHLKDVKPVPKLSSELYFIGFNQDYSCVATGGANGFKILNTDPFKETFKREFSGGIGIVEMLFRCNILALVGGGSDPAFPPSKVILWDDNQSTPIGELTFKSNVKAVKLRRDKIIVVLEKYVYVYNFDKLERIKKYETNGNNTRGLVAISPIEKCVIAFPGKNKGEVCIELIDDDAEHIIKCHENDIHCLSLNLDGSLLATASEKGTLIRIFDTKSGKKVQEVRRGADKASIFSLAFSPDSNYLAASSDKGTIHVFQINSQAKQNTKNSNSPNSSSTTQNKGEEKKNKNTINRKSKISFFGGYFKSEWSFTWFKVPECPSICCFGQDSGNMKSIIIFTVDGKQFKVLFDPKKGGDMQQKCLSTFYKSKK